MLFVIYLQHIRCTKNELKQVWLPLGFHLICCVYIEIMTNINTKEV